MINIGNEKHFHFSVAGVVAAFLLIFFAVSEPFYPQSYLEEQLRFERVRAAYNQNKLSLDALLAEKGMRSDSLNIYIRAFKQERKLEVWGQKTREEQYTLLAEYPFCAFSGDLGPKRKEGDGQIPEGYYEINHFNEESDFHLSLGLNYPNASDKILSDKKSPGSAIYIHGGCATIGCIPLTDPVIERVYLLGVMAKNSGQKTIFVHIYPFRFSSKDKLTETEENRDYQQHLQFWKSLKPAYFYFEEKKLVPRVRVDLVTGLYSLRD